MENASKALIIAGSILVSIVIITLGVMIVSNVTQTISDNSNLSAQEVASFNAPFESYLGKKSGTQVRALLQTVKSHNNVQSDESRKIGVTTSDASGINDVSARSDVEFDMDKVIKGTKNADGSYSGGIKAGYTYDVSFGIDKNSGLIIAIGLKQQ